MRSPLSVLVISLTLTALPGCDDSGTTELLGDGGPTTVSDAGLDSDAGDGATAAMTCLSGPNKACTCADGASGLQYCNAALGTYSECSCGAAPGTTMKCKAGYYTGTFEGDWRPGAFDLGGGLTLVTANISAMGTADKPGLALTLEEKTTSAGEFAFYEVKNGCVTGTATSNGLDSHPFVATMTGTLDCSTGAFDGIMDGYYELFNLGDLSVWKFSGPMLGTFNPDSASIEQGTWDLREKQAKPDEDPGAGGEGTWNAAWQSEDSPPLPPECMDLLNSNNDAGTPDGGTDAGTDAAVDAGADAGASF